MVLVVLLSVFGIFPILSNCQFVPNLNVRNVSRNPDTFLANNENVHFIAIGDWGYGHHHQYEVAEAMGVWCQDNKCDFIISNGDNLRWTLREPVYRYHYKENGSALRYGKFQCGTLHSDILTY